MQSLKHARKRGDFHLRPAIESRSATHGAPPGRSRISLDHFDRAGSPLCVYYVFIMADYQEPSDKTRGARAFCLVRGPRSTYRPPSPPFDSLIDTVMLVPPITVVHFNETSILEYDPPANVQETPRRRTRGKNKLIGGKLARKFSSLPRVNFISFEYLIFLGLLNIRILLII